MTIENNGGHAESEQAERGGIGGGVFNLGGGVGHIASRMGGWGLTGSGENHWAELATGEQSNKRKTAFWEACAIDRGEVSLAIMPTILRVRGYRIGFFSSEPDEPAHVHVAKAGNEAKFWLDPISLAWSRGFRTHDLREISELLKTHHQNLITTWNEHRNPAA